MRPTIKIAGLKEMDAALAEFSKATARNVCVRALQAAAEPIAEAAREKAPKRTGRLAKSIKVTTKKPPGHSTKVAFAEVMRAGGTKAQAAAAQRAYNRLNPTAFAEVFVAPDRLPEAWPQEIGTAHHGPQPYMRPAFEEKAEEGLGLIADAMREQIDRAAERARRKALRQKG